MLGSPQGNPKVEVEVAVDGGAAKFLPPKAGGVCFFQTIKSAGEFALKNLGWVGVMNFDFNAFCQKKQRLERGKHDTNFILHRFGCLRFPIAT